MVRTRIPPELRQRTEQACIQCKRRKSKCDGASACKSCVSRNQGQECTYVTINPRNGKTADRAELAKDATQKPLREAARLPVENANRHVPAQSTTGMATVAEDGHDWQTFPSQMSTDRYSDSVVSTDLSQSDCRTPDLTPSMLMLTGVSGKVMFVGDTSNETYLDLLRKLVVTSHGSSAFTKDVEYRTMADSNVMAPSQLESTCSVPMQEVAHRLADSFFSGTKGVLEIFRYDDIHRLLNQYYSNPQRIDRACLSHLYLMFAIGLTLATPNSAADDNHMVWKMRKTHSALADTYFDAAKHFSDASFAMDDAKLSSVQTFALMSFYLLCRANKNAAYMYCGRAVNAAFALGIHTQDIITNFSSYEQQVRFRTWSSLYILDRFLSISLGRPSSIPAEDSAIDAFDNLPCEEQAVLEKRDVLGSPHFQATLQSCRILNLISRKMYNRNQVDISDVVKLVDRFEVLKAELFPGAVLNGWSADTNLLQHLYAYLFFFHIIALAMRPVFLNRIMKDLCSDLPSTMFLREGEAESESESKCAVACVAACRLSIEIAHQALEHNCLPLSDPFSAHFIATAAFSLCANNYGYPQAHNGVKTDDWWISRGVAVLRHCGKQDITAGHFARSIENLQNLLRAKARQQRHQGPFGDSYERPPAVAPPGMNKAFQATDPGRLTLPVTDIPQLSPDAGTTQEQYGPMTDPVVLPSAALTSTWFDGDHEASAGLNQLGYADPKLGSAFGLDPQWGWPLN